MLLVRRCDTGDWELPGGHVDPGESAPDAAVRETAEESGVTVEVTAWSVSTPTPAMSSPIRVPGWCASRSRCASMPALPIRPAMRLRIDHALTPGRPCHIG
jgi:8-oxo-dGTP pyrophosphatase MutT (NUDIX family)